MALAACRSCGATLALVLDLGAQPAAGHFPAPGDPPAELAPLSLAVCSGCGLAQAGSDGPDEVDDPDAPVPTSSATGAAHATAFVDGLVTAGLAAPGTRVIELASHGGYLRPFFARAGIATTVIETTPARASRLEAAGVSVVLDRGIGADTPDTAVGVGEWVPVDIRPADLVVDHYLLSHLRRPRAALERLAGLVAPGGALVLEFDHLLPTVAGLQFDAIRHGHRSYLTLGWVARELDRLGFRVVAADPQDVYGGALRVTARRGGAAPAGEARSILDAERAASLDTPAGFGPFAEGVERIRAETVAWLEGARADGRDVVGYGAPARGVTFLNAAGIGPELLPATADRAVSKQGRLVPGVAIPIISPDALRERPALDVLVLAWDIAHEIRTAQPWIEEAGGRFVVAVPQLGVVGR